MKAIALGTAALLALASPALARPVIALTGAHPKNAVSGASAPVPEPATFAPMLAGAGLLALLMARKNRFAPR